MRSEAELRQRIEQLEKRQTQDDAVLNVVNRYWNQLNEDVRVLLQRFDAETADESENRNENEVTTSFLAQLSTWDKEELDDKLASRVQVSKRAVAKIVQVIDRLMQRHEKMALALKSSSASTGDDAEAATAVPDVEETLRQSQIEIMAENRNLQNLNTSLHEKYHTISLKISEVQDTLNGKETEAAELRNQVDDLQYELEKVRCRNDKLENHLAEAIEKLKTYHQLHGDAAKATAAAKSTSGSSSGTGASSGGSGNTTNINSQHLEDLTKDLEEQRELATNRLQELDKLHQMHRETLKEVEKLKMEIRQLPESVIVETTEYKVLQSQFSVLYNESMQIKTVLDETRNQLQSSKNQHLRQIEMMESEELVAQKKLRGEMIQMEDVMSQIRKEYEMLRIEFEQNMAANEQTAPINKEMRHLIASLQNHNSQLKGEVQRYKRKYKDAAAEVVKLTTKISEAAASSVAACSTGASAGSTGTTPGSSDAAGGAATGTSGGSTGDATASPEGQSATSGGCASTLTAVKQEPETGGDSSPKDDLGLSTVKSESDSNSENNGESEEGLITESKDGIKKEGVKQEEGVKSESKDPARMKESDMVRDLRAQLKKALNDQKEMKLLLDMYKGVSKEQRDKVQLLAHEKRMRSEIEDLRMNLKKIQESKRDDRKKMADEDAMRKIKQLEEQKYELQKQVASQKPMEGSWSAGPGGGVVAGGAGGASGYNRPFVGSHEEEALLNEMEVTGQAFEDMQEQNSRLIQQLREKDDANFKLMSDRIKANQMQKLLREEKQVLEDQVATRDTQIEAMHIVLRKLEEKERILQNTVSTIEKELVLRQQAMEMHKRKAIESAQSAADLKLHLEKYHAQMKEAQQVVAEKTSSLEAEAYKTKRLQEELGQFKRKAERMKKIEMTGTTIDEVMLEEIREYKETLTCPSCKVKRKDAVLSKCFHVFCYDCLRTRYETRQRKCPKCNCAFGANDYHRLYLST